MNNDVLPELLKQIKAAFNQEFGNNENVNNAFELIETKKATYVDAYSLAIVVGEILSKALKSIVTVDKLPDGKMYYNIAKRLIEPLLSRNYDVIAEYATDVQKILNKEAQIGLVAKKATLNQERIDGIVERFAREENFENVKWLLGEPIVNFTQSVVDDTVKENVEFHAKAGLSPKIVRKSVGHCCDWCQKLVGTYDYPDVPKDVYRRHQNCRCMVDYKPGNGTKQNVWTKNITADKKDKRFLEENFVTKNRVDDQKEYLEIRKVLGDKAPVSLAKFQELKYNDVESYKELKDHVVWNEAKFPSEKSFNGHFKSHGEEFINISKEQYQKTAASLLAEPVSEDVLGYDTEFRRVRYDHKNNIYALGNPKTKRITTMFRPKEGKEYYDVEVSKNLGS